MGRLDTQQVQVDYTHQNKNNIQVFRNLIETVFKL